MNETGNFDFYIHLIWLFVIFITILMLILCYLFLAMRRSVERESKSLVFSHLMIDGMETERRRISRELHDNILPQVRGLAVGDQIRSICTELMPPDFSRLSLNSALADLCGKFAERTGIECVYSIGKDLSFSAINAENQLHIFRMVQEAFTNIEKHSKANKATLVARQTPGGILICVSDDGIGIASSMQVSSALQASALQASELQTAGEEGLGINGIRQRAAIIGAKLDFISESGNGLMVRIEI